MRKIKKEELEYYLNELKVRKMRRYYDESPFLTTEKYKIILNNGEVIYREKLLKNKLPGSASIIVPITNEGEFLVSIEPRVFTNKTVDVGFPAGYIDQLENKKTAAIRELKEETGYVAESMILMGEFYQDQGISAAYNAYFLAQNCQKKYEQELDQDELIKFMTFNEEEIEELLYNNQMTSLNSAYAFEKAKTLLRKV